MTSHLPNNVKIFITIKFSAGHVTCKSYTILIGKSDSYDQQPAIISVSYLFFRK